ncbi:MAG: ribosome maturation factor RimM [Clostridiales bacterium]|nr:ribosome maturation factor RimM [Clostridiales bacterium]
MLDILQVGAVTSTHGLAGEVKVFPTTDDPMRYKDLKTVLVESMPVSVRNLTAGANHRQKPDSANRRTPGIRQNDTPQPSGDNFREMHIEHVRFQKNLVILKFSGLDRIEDVEWMRGHALYVTRENAVPLEDGEYFIADLIGLTVYSDEPVSVSGTAFATKLQEEPQTGIEKTLEEKSAPGFLLGKLSDVLQTGANDVYEVKLADGREVLIPAIRQCILNVDLKQGTMLVHLLEGLLE